MEVSENLQSSSRREIKYALPGVDVGKLRTLLSGACHRQIYNKSVTTVRSIYFDDWRLSSCQDNLTGVGRRWKLRVRWYDELWPTENFFFEVKWRKNLVTGKHRFPISLTRSLPDLTYRAFVSDLTASLPQSYAGLLLERREPVLLVEYRREHFVSRDQKARLTLDYDLKFYDQMGKQKPRMEFPVAMDGFVVIEGKVSGPKNSAIRDCLYPFSPRATRCSKYLHGCRVLGVMNGIANSLD